MLSFVTCLPLCIGCHLLCSSYDFPLSIHHSPLLCIGCKLFHLASILDPLHWTCSLSTVVVLSLLVRPFALEASNLFILEASVSSLVSLSISTKILTNFHYCMMLKLFLVFCEKACVGVSREDHVTGAVCDSIGWVCGHIVLQLVNCFGCVFRGFGLLGANDAQCG